MNRLLRTLKASVKRSMPSWMVGAVSSTSGNSSSTARATLTGFTNPLGSTLPLASDPDALLGDRVVVALDPGNEITGVAFFDNVAPDYEPKWSDRLAFWQRTKARLTERKLERLRTQQRDQMSIYEWAGSDEFMDKLGDMVGALKANSITGDQLVAGSIVWQDEPGGRPVDMTRLEETTSFTDATPISSARRTARQIETLHTIDVDEVFWDIASMIDAHRNGATALERPLRPTQGIVGRTPVWDSTVEDLWDPKKEPGPTELEWRLESQERRRRNLQRQQPQKKTRSERRKK